MTEGHEGPAERAPESGGGVLWVGRPHGGIRRVGRSPEEPQYGFGGYLYGPYILHFLHFCIIYTLHLQKN